jgi:hypothetical protein
MIQDHGNRLGSVGHWLTAALDHVLRLVATVSEWLS